VSPSQSVNYLHHTVLAGSAEFEEGS
jgi:hypothetical protein